VHDAGVPGLKRTGSRTGSLALVTTAWRVCLRGGSQVCAFQSGDTNCSSSSYARLTSNVHGPSLQPPAKSRAQHSSLLPESSTHGRVRYLCELLGKLEETLSDKSLRWLCPSRNIYPLTPTPVREKNMHWRVPTIHEILLGTRTQANDPLLHFTPHHPSSAAGTL